MNITLVTQHLHFPSFLLRVFLYTSFTLWAAVIIGRHVFWNFNQIIVVLYRSSVSLLACQVWLKRLARPPLTTIMDNMCVFPLACRQTSQFNPYNLGFLSSFNRSITHIRLVCVPCDRTPKGVKHDLQVFNIKLNEKTFNDHNNHVCRFAFKL